MKRKLLVGVLTAVLVVGGATAAMAATDSSKLAEIKSLTQQMFGIHKQILDKEVEAGLMTQQQADTMKKNLDQQQQRQEQAIDQGQALGPGLKPNMGAFNFNNGQPLTDDQIKAWDEAMQKRLQAQADQMKKNGLTDEQIKTWSDAAKTQLKVQEEAMKNGTFVPGAFGMGGKGMRGGHFGSPWGGQNGSAPAVNRNTVAQ